MKQLIYSEKPDVVSGGAIYYVKHHPDFPIAAFRFEDKFERLCSMYIYHNERYFVPRYAVPKGKIDNTSQGLKINFKSNMTPRNEDQALVIAQSLAHLEESVSHIVECPTGFGKTFIACALIYHIGRKAVIIVPKSDLIEQWKKSLKTFLCLKEEEIGLIKADKCITEGKKVIIAQIQTLSKLKYQKHLRDTGFAIWDEVHRVASDTFQRSCFLVPARLRLGLSARSKRKDGRDRVLRYNIGEVLVKSERPSIPFTVVFYFTDWQCPKINHSPGRSAHVTKILSYSSERHNVIFKFLSAAIKKGRKTVIFSDFLNHLKRIETYCLHRGLDKDLFGYYVSKAGGKTIGETIDLEESANKQIILATYGMMGEGTNIEDIDACILATPRADVMQVIGRVLREKAGKKAPVILDLVDNSSFVYKKYYFKRREFYKSVGAALKSKSSMGN